MSDSSDRPAKRSPVVLRIKLRYETVEIFVRKFSANLSRGGMFIASKKPKPPGTPLSFELRLADGSTILAGHGTVSWTRDFDPQRPKSPHGMGVEFTELSPDSVDVLEQVSAARADKGLDLDAIPRTPRALRKKAAEPAEAPAEAAKAPAEPAGAPAEADSKAPAQEEASKETAAEDKPAAKPKKRKRRESRAKAGKGKTRKRRTTGDPEKSGNSKPKRKKKKRAAVDEAPAEPPANLQSDFVTDRGEIERRRSARIPVAELISRVTAPVQLADETLDDMFAKSGIQDVADVIGAARKLTAGSSADDRLAELVEDSAAPLAPTIDAASAELAELLGGKSVDSAKRFKSSRIDLSEIVHRAPERPAEPEPVPGAAEPNARDDLFADGSHPPAASAADPSSPQAIAAKAQLAIDSALEAAEELDRRFPLFEESELGTQPQEPASDEPARVDEPVVEPEPADSGQAAPADEPVAADDEPAAAEPAAAELAPADAVPIPSEPTIDSAAPATEPAVDGVPLATEPAAAAEFAEAEVPESASTSAPAVDDFADGHDTIVPPIADQVLPSPTDDPPVDATVDSELVPGSIPESPISDAHSAAIDRALAPLEEFSGDDPELAVKNEPAEQTADRALPASYEIHPEMDSLTDPDEVTMAEPIPSIGGVDVGAAESARFADDFVGEDPTRVDRGDLALDPSAPAEPQQPAGGLHQPAPQLPQLDLAEPQRPVGETKLPEPPEPPPLQSRPAKPAALGALRSALASRGHRTTPAPGLPPLPGTTPAPIPVPVEDRAPVADLGQVEPEPAAAPAAKPSFDSNVDDALAALEAPGPDPVEAPPVSKPPVRPPPLPRRSAPPPLPSAPLPDAPTYLVDSSGEGGDAPAPAEDGIDVSFEDSAPVATIPDADGDVEVDLDGDDVDSDLKRKGFFGRLFRGK